MAQGGKARDEEGPIRHCSKPHRHPGGPGHEVAACALVVAGVVLRAEVEGGVAGDPVGQADARTLVSIVAAVMNAGVADVDIKPQRKAEFLGRHERAE